jgi:hypothetical protein
MAKLGIRNRVVPVVTATIIRPRKQRFVRGQFDPDAAADYTPADIAVLKACDACRRLNHLSHLSIVQVAAVIHSMGGRFSAEAAPLPVFETGAGRPSGKP